MREYPLRLLLALLFAGAAGAHADNSLHGLEMDVMDAGESAAHATARIALPRMAASMADAPDLPALEAEQTDRGGSVARDSLIGPAGAVDALDPASGGGAGDADIAKPAIDPGSPGDVPADTIEDPPTSKP